MASASTVDVYCALPHGLILQCQQERDVSVPAGHGAMRTEKQWVKAGDTITVHGAARALDARGGPVIVEMGRHHFAITPNVPADFWRRWLSQNESHDFVSKGFIFAHKRRSDAEKQAKDADDRTGFEPGDPSALPAEFRNITKADVK